ncbi:MAG: phage tail tape measure protein, partial [Fusobacteriaceae bacterium]
MSNYALSASLRLKDEFTRTIRSARNQFGSLSKSYRQNAEAFSAYQKKMKGNLDSFNKGIGKVKTVAMGVGGALTAAVGVAYNSYVDLNYQLTKNQAIMNASAEDAGKLTKQVKDLGASTAFSALEVAQAHQYQAQAGYDVNRI